MRMFLDECYRAAIVIVVVHVAFKIISICFAFFFSYNCVHASTKLGHKLGYPQNFTCARVRVCVYLPRALCHLLCFFLLFRVSINIEWLWTQTHTHTHLIQDKKQTANIESNISIIQILQVVLPAFARACVYQFFDNVDVGIDQHTYICLVYICVLLNCSTRRVIVRHYTVFFFLFFLSNRKFRNYYHIQ